MNEKPKKIVVIGAGIAGLCAGVYARRSGFDVEILEMNQVSGGLATSWKRNDYVFENCLQWLLGSRRGTTWHSLWREVFDIDALQFIDGEELLRLETEDGQTLSIPRDVNELEREWRRFAPEDALAIKRLVRGVRRLQNFDIPVPGEHRWQAWGQSIRQSIRMIPYVPELRYWSQMTLRELGQQFQNPLLRQYLGGGALDQVSAVAIVLSMAWRSAKNAGYPLGGSKAVIQGIEREFWKLGGKIRFESKVERILTEDRRAVGVHLSDGQQIRADWVISAADGHSTVFDWVPEVFRDEKATKPYRSFPTFSSYVQVSFGVRRELHQLPGHFTRILRTPIEIDPGTSVSELSFRVFHFDPTFAPRGKTAVTCFVSTANYEYWVKLRRENPDAYQAKKREIANAVAQAFERKVPGIRADIEVVDVATPATVQRYTGNWKGSMEGFLPTPKAGFRPLRTKLEGLEGFRMIGQWVMPGGGLPSGLMTARQCIQEICRVEDRRFETAVRRPLARVRRG